MYFGEKKCFQLFLELSIIIYNQLHDNLRYFIMNKQGKFLKVLCWWEYNVRYNLVLSAGLKMWIGHHKEIWITLWWPIHIYVNFVDKTKLFYYGVGGSWGVFYIQDLSRVTVFCSLSQDTLLLQH